MLFMPIPAVDNNLHSSVGTNYDCEIYQSLESLYDDIIKRTGGFAPYQKLATFVIISSFTLYYCQFFALNFLLFEPDYECLV